MRRRVVLGSLGSLGSLGILGYSTRPPADVLDVRFWLSPSADRYDHVSERVGEYLDQSLSLDHWSVEVMYGGVVDVSTENGAVVTKRGEWPTAVGAGAIGRADIEPASDVNLLVTDGQMRTTPTGFALPHVASVGGARYIDALEPIDALETVDDAERIVPYSTPNRVIQVLIHEVGHALGLRHDHGVAFRLGDAVVATPMLSTYAWDDTYEIDRSTCGTSYPDTAGYGRLLTHVYSTCARRELEGYRGGLTP